MSAADLPIVHYTAERIPNPNPGGLTWQAYHSVRNEVVRACREFGSTGPMGECRILDAPEPPGGSDWPLGDNPSAFFVVDDQYNDERYIYMEVEPGAPADLEWLARLTDALRNHPGWGIGISNVRKGYALLFADRIMITGPAFDGCRDSDAFLRAMQKSVY